MLAWGGIAIFPLEPLTKSPQVSRTGFVHLKFKRKFLPVVGCWDNCTEFGCRKKSKFERQSFCCWDEKMKGSEKMPSAGHRTRHLHVQWACLQQAK